MSWTEDRVELLKKTYQDGLTASQIAAELGGFEHCIDRGRSAVIGKIHRLKLPLRRDTTPAPKKRTVVRAPVERKRKPKVAPAVAEDAAAEAFVQATESMLAPAPDERRVQIIDLDATTCRWPVGDPQSPAFYFCGAMPFAASPYCRFHDRMAYQPVTMRSRS